jgi:hypothetical protein
LEVAGYFLMVYDWACYEGLLAFHRGLLPRLSNSEQQIIEHFVSR